jgi:uncharacterized protein (TIGR04255 family)
MNFDGIHLKTDSIKEALCELRFTTDTTAEIVIGRLADSQEWDGFLLTRLPTADFPPQLRELDPAIKFQPTFELRSQDSPTRIVRIGPNSMSCHVLAPYPGWLEFEPFLNSAITALYKKLSLTVNRIGFRYINALNEVQHLISNARDLNLNIQVDSQDVMEMFALNYRRKLAEEHLCQINVATPEYVLAPEGETFSAMLDIDVFNPDGIIFADPASVMNWISSAHNHLKAQYFSLLPEKIIEQLIRK